METDSEGGSDVDKFPGNGLLRFGGRTRLLSSNRYKQRREKENPQEKTHTELILQQVGF